jgi:CRP-like cAMP-binding protein
LGELSFFSSKLHSSKGVALKETHALILTKEGYEKLKEEDPHLAVKLLEAIARVIAERLKEMNKKFVDTTCFIWGGPKK